MSASVCSRCSRWAAVLPGLLLVVALLGFGPLVQGNLTAQTPRSWNLLHVDPPGGCGSGQLERDVTTAYWAIEGGLLHLRLCTVASPGWNPTQGGGWSDARYKWWLSTASREFLLMVEDFPAQAPDQPAADGMGEITLIDERNGNGRFTDEWATRQPPQYLDNALGSPYWRRAWSATSGPDQQSTLGDTRDVGFRTGMTSCGGSLDVYVRLAVLESPSEVCLFWATDDEAPLLDGRPVCDSAPAGACIALASTATASATVNLRPTQTAHLAPTATPTLTPPPQATVAASATPTATPTPSRAASATSTPTADRTASATGTATATTTPTATIVASPSPTGKTASATATATGQAAATIRATPTAPHSSTPSVTATTTPASHLPTGTATVTATASQTAAATTTAAAPDAGCLTVYLRDMTSGQPQPFPDPASVHAVLLTPWGAPAKPALVQPLGPQGSTTFFNMEAGTYRVWATVGPGWQLWPGTTSPQVIGVNPQPPCSQVIFRYVATGGIPPMPPGPPTGIPTPPPLPTTTVAATAYPPSPSRPVVAAAIQLPVLGFLGADPACAAGIDVQNIGDQPAKAILLVWGTHSSCPPQCAGPLKVECSGLLVPGGSWRFVGAQLPHGANSGLVISASARPYGSDTYADALCQALRTETVGNCEAYRRFRQAFEEQGRWQGFDFALERPQPLAVHVQRECPGDSRTMVRVASSYEGLATESLGRWDALFGGYAYFVPVVWSGRAGFNTLLYLQNAGWSCGSVELWFRAEDDCLRPRVCDILTLSPGETVAYDVTTCIPASWSGAAWLRSTVPLAVVVDVVGSDVLMSYTAQPSELYYVADGEPILAAGSPVAYAPLVFSGYHGWDTAIIVQNTSSLAAAKIKLYLTDASGAVTATVADWVCPLGVRTFFVPAIAALPGHWLGAARIESQDWFTPGGPIVRGPNVQAVALLVRYADLSRSAAQEALAYNLMPEPVAFDGSPRADQPAVNAGCGRVGLPRLVRDASESGASSALAIANLVLRPGHTNFVVFLCDQNGLVDTVCETLAHGQNEYIDLATWGFIHPGFRGSALVSASSWSHPVLDAQGRVARNLVGLGAVAIQRSGALLTSPLPGDPACASLGVPIFGPLPFSGPAAPRCPGQTVPLPPGPRTATPTPSRSSGTPSLPPPPPFTPPVP